MKEATIFSDGASRGNPGRGGWGAIIVEDSKVVELGGFVARTTNNQMELAAIVGGLKEVASESVKIFTDSKYVMNGATKWANNWQRNGWQTVKKEPVINKELWQELLALQAVKKIQWELVPGHVGVKGNERADEIATEFADQKDVDLFEGLLSEYGIDVFSIEHSQEKKSSKDRSRAKAHSYISCVDKKIQIHQSWAECEKRVKGKKALFKKSLSAEDERVVIDEFVSKGCGR